MTIEAILHSGVIKAITKLYDTKTLKLNESQIQIYKTRKDFTGDYTLVVFPFLQISKKSPEKTAEEIGRFLKIHLPEVTDYNVIKGFLNLSISSMYWIIFLNKTHRLKNFGILPEAENAQNYVVEFSSPNTNKPLHLGHIRNNLLGDSVSEILKANGKIVHKVNLVNDRGIHICKSMLAWQKWGNGETPEQAGLKGDHLVGKYYVMFEKEYKKQIVEMLDKGIANDIAQRTAPLMLEAQEMLLKWEASDRAVKQLWHKMNSWVYAGFESTYKNMGIHFDKFYYESETYTLGKTTVLEALHARYIWIQKKEDGSIWADLTKDGLDEKILLRSDGTSVYITQDIGTAIERYQDYKFDKHIYVVANEQDYHFNVLSIILNKLGYNWAKNLYHLSYGMVELPDGRMKSREGTVVDADDLIEKMISQARETSRELGKLDNLSDAKVEHTVRLIALGALKYFILRVDPKKNMTFNPTESIDFNGNTGPFIQYSFARIQSILRKANDMDLYIPLEIEPAMDVSKKEIDLLKLVHDFPNVVKDAGENLSPALIANYAYDLAKEFNQFYHDFFIIKEEKTELREFRLLLSELVGRVIKSAMKLLGIEVPEQM